MVINNLLSFFWWYVDFLSFVFFFFTLCFTYWSNFIGCFISNQISCRFWIFLNYSLKSSFFAASIPVFVAVSINVLPYLPPNFLTNDEKPYLLTYFLNFGSVEYLIFIIYAQYCVVFILCSISSGLLFWLSKP